MLIWQSQGNIDKIFNLPKWFTNIIDRYQGKPYLHRHNPNCFDENDYVKGDGLYRFIKKNLYLTKKELEVERKQPPVKLYREGKKLKPIVENCFMKMKTR